MPSKKTRLPAALPVDLAALERWMDAHDLGSGPLEAPALLGGGTQNILLRFARAGRGYVLRRPPLHLRDNSNETMRREARVLAALAGSEVPHPRLIASCPDETVLGAAFYLMEPVDGFNPMVGLPPLHAGHPEIRRRMGLAMVDGILALGRIDHVAAGLADLGKVEGYLARQVPRWKSLLATYADLRDWPGPEAIPGVDLVADWLARYCPTHFVPGIIHGDYHVANVLFRHDSAELAAIVDWELATIGDPLIDLGWLLATWADPEQPCAAELRVTPWDGFPRAGQLVERYASGGGRDISQIDWYAVLACYKLGIILEGTYARACAGKAPMDVGLRLHGQTVGLFERALNWIERH